MPSKLKTLVSRSVLVITTVLLLSSCGIFKNKTTTRTKETNKEVLRVDSVKKESSEVSSGVKEVQKDVNTKTTETTTKTTTKGGNSKVEVKRDDFRDGKTELLDSFGRKIIISLDSLRKSLTIEIDAPEVTEETTTKVTEQQDNSKEKEQQETNKVSKEATLGKTEEKESSKNNTEKESKASFWGIVGMYVGIALLVVIIILAVKKFIFNR